MTYYLDDRVVCKCFWIHSVTKRVGSSSIQKSKDGFTRQDLCSKTGNRKFWDNAVNKVIDHNKSFPIMEFFGTTYLLI